MCGGCWESHAKMNNNQLLVTIDHDHTCGSCVRVSFSLSSSFSPSVSLSHSNTHTRTHTQTAFSVWFTNTLRFHLTPLPLSPASAQCNIDIWVEGHTTHSTLPHCVPDPLSARLVIPRKWQCGCACAHIQQRPQRVFSFCGSISGPAHIHRYCQCL